MLNSQAAILILQQWSVKRTHKCFHIPNKIQRHTLVKILEEAQEMSCSLNESCWNNAGKWLPS